MSAFHGSLRFVSGLLLVACSTQSSVSSDTAEDAGADDHTDASAVDAFGESATTDASIGNGQDSGSVDASAALSWWKSTTPVPITLRWTCSVKDVFDWIGVWSSDCPKLWTQGATCHVVEESGSIVGTATASSGDSRTFNLHFDSAAVPSESAALVGCGASPTAESPEWQLKCADDWSNKSTPCPALGSAWEPRTAHTIITGIEGDYDSYSYLTKTGSSMRTPASVKASQLSTTSGVAAGCDERNGGPLSTIANHFALEVAGSATLTASFLAAEGDYGGGWEASCSVTIEPVGLDQAAP